MRCNQLQTMSIFELDFAPAPPPLVQGGHAANTWINVCELGIKYTTHTVIINCVNELGGAVRTFTIKGAWLKAWLDGLLRVQFDCTSQGYLLIRHQHGYALIKDDQAIAPTIRPKLPPRKERWQAGYDQQYAEAMRTFEQRKDKGTTTVKIIIS